MIEGERPVFGECRQGLDHEERTCPGLLGDKFGEWLRAFAATAKRDSDQLHKMFTRKWKQVDFLH